MTLGDKGRPVTLKFRSTLTTCLCTGCTLTASCALSAHRPQRSGMGEVARPVRNRNVRVCMYPDHLPAHIHVYDRATGLAAWVPLSRLIRDAGRSSIPRQPRNDLREVLIGAANNRTMLKEHWRKIRAGHR